MALQRPAPSVCADPGATTPPPALGRQLLLGFGTADDDRRHDADVQPADVGPAPAGPIAGFIGRQEVETIDGPMRISRLCEKRLGLHVRTFAEGRGEWVYRPIVGWHVARAAWTTCSPSSWTTRSASTSPPTSASCSPTVDRARRSAAGAGRGPGHLGADPTEDQWDLMYGSLLGDASSTAVGFTCEHSVKQAEYLAWKQSVLCGLGACTFDRKERKVPSTIRGEPIRSSPSRIVCVGERHVYEELRKECYGGQDDEKRVTDAWLARVGGLGVTAWVLDDGLDHQPGARGAGSASRATSPRTASCPRTASGSPPGCPGATATPARSTSSAAFPVGVPGAALIEEVARWVPWRAIRSRRSSSAESVARNPVGGAAAGDRLDVPAGPSPRRSGRYWPYRHDKPDIPEINVYSLTVEETRTSCAARSWSPAPDPPPPIPSSPPPPAS